MSSSDEEPKLPVSERVATFVKAFERAVAFALLVLLVTVVTLTTVELAALVVRDVSLAKDKLLDQDQMLELFGAFLLVLIGMELLTSLKDYVRHGAVRAELVLEVAGLGARHQTGWTALIPSLMELFGMIEPAQVLAEERPLALLHGERPVEAPGEALP